ncbi:MAG TPA: DNA-binding response regulator [Acidimicrobiaceae bacterium]|nr:DNA-binding response regulator [Acidimicrobiaceae bacterium]MDP7258346.1 response regulator transcription factor [Acidimicrobiales bacterium]HCV35755.1 DNA-binding response regulator [Acidimicrobiaceae bacterium]HJO79210.1 response regulator transcription factor [Acidimicrobiales bacterium]
MRILLVDDEADLVDAIARGLRRNGYAVDMALNGEEALAKASWIPYDLICLDITMPGMDGFEVCRSLRESPPEGVAPRILMLTARDTVEERIRGLDVGADDYLVKPFAFDELAARVRSLLRRDPGRTGSVLEVGALRLDTATHEVAHDGRSLDLTAKEFALLRYFMSRPGEVISQEDLLDHVWDEHADPFTNTVRVTVGTLRRKLSVEDEPPLIDTIVGSGYRLVVDGGRI